MDRSDSPKLTAAECAARTGLTVRALRVYEEYGLIEPKRSAGGWRQYDSDDLVKLSTIGLLKTAGLSLAQIREVTQSSPQALSLQQILEIQLATWKMRLADAERGRAITQAALERLAQVHSLSVDELCNVIRSFEMSQTSQPPPATNEPEIEEVSLEPPVLDRYVGFYAPHNGEFGHYTVTRDGGKLLIQTTTTQPPFDLSAVGETQFTLKIVGAHITFQQDAGGNTTGLVLRQMGVETEATRIDEAAAQQIRAQLTARIENKTPVPGSEAALCRLIEGIRAGTPDYAEMSPPFAQLMQRTLPRLQAIAAYLGEIRSMEFQGVGSQGWDVYDVQRERGSARWRIALGSDNKIYGALAILTSPISLGP